MAKKYNNDKNFLIIQLDPFVARFECNIGNICDICNNRIDSLETDGFGDIYYIAAINRAVCKRCCDDVIKGMNKSPEDESYEKRNYNYYAKILGLEIV